MVQIISTRLYEYVYVVLKKEYSTKEMYKLVTYNNKRLNRHSNRAHIIGTFE